MYVRLPSACRGLLVTLDYPQVEKQGPPFSVPDSEVQALYGRDWAVDTLEHQDILAQQPGFAVEGVTHLQTAAYRLDRRDA